MRSQFKRSRNERTAFCRQHCNCRGKTTHHIFAATALHQAAAKGHTETCAALVTAGANIDAQDCDGFTPLMLACLGKKTEAMKKLVELGADVSLKNKKGNTVFHLLSETNQSALINEITSLSNNRLAPNVSVQPSI